MSSVFISHSAVDKPFVKQLAFGLLNNGIPIWLDNWQLTAGDSLTDNIDEEIDASSVVILVMSENSIKSDWVERELQAALDKEKQVGRKFLIPVRVDDCHPPSQVADRLYAEFSKSEPFSASLEKLTETLVNMGCRDIGVLPERELLGLSFTNEVHLDVQSLVQACDHMSARGNLLTLTPEQVIINDDPEVGVLREKLHYNIDNVAKHKDYSPELERSLRVGLLEIQDRKIYIALGIIELVRNRLSDQSMYWFAKIIRAQMINRLYSLQLKGDSIIEYGNTWMDSDLSSNFSANRFFGVDDILRCELWSRGNSSGYFSLWVPKRQCRDLYHADGMYIGPSPYYDVCSGRARDKYVFPQMLLSHLMSPRPGREPIWDLSQAIIGVS